LFANTDLDLPTRRIKQRKSSKKMHSLVGQSPFAQRPKMSQKDLFNPGGEKTPILAETLQHFSPVKKLNQESV